MKKKKMAIKNLLVCILVFSFFITCGCAELIPLAAGVAINTVKDLAPDKPIFTAKKKRQNFVPTLNVDTEETIIKNFGKPNEIFVVDSRRKVLFYESVITPNLTFLYAIKNGIYQGKFKADTDGMAKGKAMGENVFKNAVIKTFPCFHEEYTATEIKPDDSL